MGYEYEVREFHESKNFQGQKSYDYNFLQEDVQTNMKSGGRRQGQKWFKNDTALRSGWANIHAQIMVKLSRTARMRIKNWPRMLPKIQEQ